MNFSAFTLGLVFASFALATLASAKITTKIEKRETYAAMEADLPLDAPAPAVQPKKNPPAAAAPATAPIRGTAPAPAMTKNTPAPQHAATTPQTAFDSVPGDQIPPLTKRLRLVEELIRKHQRAYDYRVLTTRELERILTQLDAKSAPATKHTSPAPIEEPSDPVEPDEAPELPPFEPVSEPVAAVPVPNSELPEPSESNLGYPAPSF